jgi:hypothetical protein
MVRDFFSFLADRHRKTGGSPGIRDQFGIDARIIESSRTLRSGLARLSGR